ncbi:acyl-CoA-binding domain-containing protein 7 isoform X2 [Salmo trutta]|uniref:acyl-CoA-binding domain-containing protein 7 isoform X2 n=1 Tax=Salmo trutta TaxID=8032 RepID=UPI00112FF464|nr:acyl-CoA-binding domain-containing protein 7-like isoform X2 [Salmo trutta]
MWNRNSFGGFLSERVAERKLFERVADDVKKVKSRPSDQELLDMYGLYKQAIFADINIDKPGMLDMKGKTKWEAWDSRKGE